MEGLHARLSPSGAKKWMTCAGSVAMEHGEPDDSSEYADEGTAAHWLAAECLRANAHPAAYLGRVITLVDSVVADTPAPPGTKGKVRTYEADAEMVAAVNVYICSVREYAALGELHVEQAVPIDHITSEEGATGTADAVVVIADNPVGDDELQVHDLKYGVGVRVYAERNPQLMMYALGVMRKFPGVYANVRLVIHQPRLDHCDEWVTDAAELHSFANEAAQRARDASIALTHAANWIGKDSNYLVAGEHCHDCFCKARAKCPALAKLVTDAIGADFSVIVNSGVPAQQAVDVLVDQRGNAVLAEKFKAIDTIMDWCKAVRAKAEALLFENNNSPDIIRLLGIKLVQGKKGNRAWRDAAEAEKLFKSMRLKIEEMYDMTLISPTTAEKRLKDTPKRWARALPLIEQKPGQPSVVTVSDKRPAIEIAPAIEDFDVIEEDNYV